jgi:hypothetical protein
MSEAADHLWPAWIVVEARDCQLLKGIKLKEPNQELQLITRPPTYGSSDSFEVNAVIQTEQADGQLRLHYRSIFRFELQLPPRFKHEPQLFTEKELAVTKAYDEFLFHGPRFQVIERIDGLSDGGAHALVRTTCPEQWLANIETDHHHWVFDPAVVDTAAQMAILWCRIFRNETALPVRFGRVVRCCETLPDKLVMHFERIPSEESHLVRANVYFTDADNQIALLIEDMECVSSADLNRIAGTAKLNSNSGAPNLLAKEA